MIQCTTYLGGTEGHISRDCTMEQKAKTCYKCGQEGHIVRIRQLTGRLANLGSASPTSIKIRGGSLTRRLFVSLGSHPIVS